MDKPVNYGSSEDVTVEQTATVREAAKDAPPPEVDLAPLGGRAGR